MKRMKIPSVPMMSMNLLAAWSHGVVYEPRDHLHDISTKFLKVIFSSGITPLRSFLMLEITENDDDQEHDGNDDAVGDVGGRDDRPGMRETHVNCSCPILFPPAPD